MNECKRSGSPIANALQSPWPTLLAGTALLAFLCSYESAVAQEEVDPFALSPEQLFDATVVSVSRMPERLGDAPAAIYVLTSEDIRRSGATSIPEALRLVPGVDVARVNTSSWAISVRGFNSTSANKLLVLIDGRAVYDPLFSGVYWDVQDTALEDIERIEVIRGPGASQWGVNAVNGVINIITKKATDTKGLLLSTIAGNREQPVVTMRYGGDAGERVHWRIYGKYLSRPSGNRLNGLDAQDAWEASRGGFRVDWDPDGGHDNFTLQGDLYRSDSGQLTLVPQLTAPYAVLKKNNIYAQGGNLLGHWSHEFGNSSRLAVQTYLDMTERGQLVLKDRRTTFDFDAQYEFPAWDRHKLMTGVGYRYAVDDLTQTPLVTFAKATQREQLFSGFVQDEITLEPERWFVTLGSKFEHHYFTGFEVQPSARLQWHLDEGQTAWASVSRAVRTPSELERNLDLLAGVLPPVGPGLPTSYELIPNPTFQSEELIAYELGYRRKWTPSVLSDVSLFYNDYDNLSSVTMRPAQVGANPPHVILPLAITNFAAAKTYGFEAVVNWRAQEHLNFSAAYSVISIDVHDPPSTLALSSIALEKQSPQQQFNLRSQWDVSERGTFDTTLYYVARLPAYQINAYWRLDARLGWRLTDQLQFDLVGQNLLMDSHREFGAPTTVNATRIGRSIFGRLTWRP